MPHAMTVKEFKTIGPRDWSNGAVQDEIYTALKQREALLEAVKGALRIESLWMPPDDQNDPEYDNEFAALATMRQQFREVIDLT